VCRGLKRVAHPPASEAQLSGDTRLLLLASTGLVLMPFWSIEMVVSAFACVVLTCLRSRSRQASCLELCNPQHPSTTL
jgi:hypothetical protein